MAIEDAAALGILFSDKCFTGDVRETLAIYEKIRLPRATKVQSSAAKAAYNINERIGMYLNNRDSRISLHALANVASRLLKQYNYV